MASINRDPNGRRTIQFVGGDGKRRSIRLGKVAQRTAEGVKVRVEALVAAAITGHAADAETARWVAALDATLADKLGAVGLIPKPEAKAAVTLGPFLDAYIAGRTDVAPRTTQRLNETRAKLVEFFGADRPLAAVTLGDADEFRRHLSQRLGDNTMRRQCGRAKQFFRAAVRKRLIAESPFADMKGCGVQANRSRDYFLTLADAQKVLDACPNSQWRLLFALSRFGGLRCPSEHLALRWGDVDSARNRMVVQSPKTKRYDGHESRVVPIFPELLPHLEEAFELAAPGTEFVVTRSRDTDTNLRTQMERIIRRAGLEPWPKLFQNLRATRETELAQTFPMHVVCSWIGNSQAVAAKHYLQVTEGHFSDATKAVQNPVQQAHETGRTVSQALPAA